MNNEGACNSPIVTHNWKCYCLIIWWKQFVWSGCNTKPVWTTRVMQRVVLMGLYHTSQLLCSGHFMPLVWNCLNGVRSVDNTYFRMFIDDWLTGGIKKIQNYRKWRISLQRLTSSHSKAFIPGIILTSGNAKSHILLVPISSFSHTHIHGISLSKPLFHTKACLHQQQTIHALNFFCMFSWKDHSTSSHIPRSWHPALIL